MRIRVLSVLAVFFIVSGGTLSGATVTGKVLDGAAGHPPIPYVDVRAVDAAGTPLGVTVLTGPQGEYSLENISSGQVITIKFEKTNYIDKPTILPNIAVSSDITVVGVTYMARTDGDATYYQFLARGMAETPSVARLLQHLGSTEQDLVKRFMQDIEQQYDVKDNNRQRVDTESPPRPE